MRFALVGAAGYIAPRHMQAIREIGGELVAAFDPRDSVGIIDSYFPQADFFVEFERFDRHIDKLRRAGPGHAVDYIAICSPNYLHDAHVRFALRVGANVICEKPIVLNPWNIQALREVEAESAGRVNTILQLRLHPAIIALRDRVAGSDRIHEVELVYQTSRGHWYDVSWKGDVKKSGGIATNIGVHFFDMLHWIFGATRRSELTAASARTNSGVLELERARVRWKLSIDEAELPPDVRAAKKRTFRHITVDGEPLEFSEGFTDLHTLSYRAIIENRGFRMDDCLAAIETVADIRQAAARLCPEI
ncbi:MAG: Gfo/Idh/MocA family oxidoreductase [Lautropia sp.]